MPARRAIGVDLGGTKLLAGAVDPGLGVHHRAQRTVTGLDQRRCSMSSSTPCTRCATLTGDEVEAVGFGIPCLIDQRTGTAVMAVNLPLADIAFADVMAERLGLPVFVDNDGNAAAHRRAPRRRRPRGQRGGLMTIGTGIGGGLILRGEPYRGGDRRRRPSSATW